MHIIHKDIKPRNILWNAETGVIKLIDFEIAGQMTRERQIISASNLLQGSLAYISG